MAQKTWVGSADNSWSLATNWLEGSVPVTTDTVTFSGVGVTNCTIDALGTFSGGTIDLTAAWANTITQNSGINLNIAGFTQAAGTLTCSATATWTSTTFALSGGTFTQGGAFVSTTFGITGTGIYTGSSATMSTTAVTHSNTATITATSGIWSLAGSWTKNNTPTFNANSGTINITAASTFSPAVTLNLVTINTAAAVTIASGTTCPLGSAPTSTTGAGNNFGVTGVVTWTGLWTHTGSIVVNAGGTLTGSSTPTINVSSNLNISATGTITNTIGTITLATANGCTLTDTGDKLSASTFIIGDGTSKAVVVAASTTCRIGTTPTSNIGTSTLTVTGTLTYSGAWTHTGSLTTSASSTVTGSASPSLTINQSLTLNSTSTWTSVNVTASGSLACTYTDTGAKNSGTWTITRSGNAQFIVAASTSCSLGANPTSTCGTQTLSVTGTIAWSGNWAHTGAIATTGTMTGTSTPTLTLDGNLTTSSATITNAIGTVTFNGSVGSSTYTDTGDKLSASTFVVSKTNQGMTVAASTTMRLGSAPTSTCGTSTFTVTGTLLYSGLWTHTGQLTTSASSTVTGSTSPSLALVSGNLNISATASGWTSVNVAVSGSTTNSYTDTGAKNSGTWTINKSAGAFTVAASTTMALGANPNITIGGTFVVTGTATASGAWVHGAGGITVGAAGVVSGALTSLAITSGGFTITAGGTWPASVAITFLGTTQTVDCSGITFATCAINKTGSLTITSGTTIPLGASPTSTTGLGRIQINGGLSVSGTWNHTGGITIGATGTLSGNNTSIIMVDGAWVFTAGGAMPTGFNIEQNFLTATARNFDGGGQAYAIYKRTGAGTATVTYTGSNTFTTFTDNAGLAAHTLTFTAGTTQTATTWNLGGSVGKLLTYNSSSAGTPAIQTNTGATETIVPYAVISDSTVDATPKWFAGEGSTLGTGNTNWLLETSGGTMPIARHARSRRGR